MRLVTLALVLALAGCASTAPPAAASLDGSALGITWSSVDSLDARLPPDVRVYAGVSTSDTLRTWAVRLAPKIPLRVEVATDTVDGRERPTSFAARTGACVVVNGGYFNMQTGVPVGLVVRDGAVTAPATVEAMRDSVRYDVLRGAVGLDDAGTRIAWAGGDASSACAADAPIPNHPGTPGDAAAACELWTVRDALGAGPVLLHDGQMAVATDAEVFWGSHANRHPRSAIGVDASGAVWLVVVDGRQPLSRGVRLEELAAILRGLGAVNALNLDGGGSSALVVRPDGGPPVRLNLPTGADVEREVSTALAAMCPRG